MTMRVVPSGPAGSQTVRDHNQRLVLAALAEAREGASRAQLSASTGLTRATVGTLVEDLISDGLVIESSPLRGSRGRPGSPVSLNPDGPAGLGIEINVDYLASCVIDLTGHVRATRIEVVDNRARDPRAVIAAAVALAARVRAEAGLPLAGVGVALAGLVDDRGVLRRAPNLGWRDVDVVSALKVEAHDWIADSSLRVENEANLAALAELWYGERPWLRDFVQLSGEIGIGAGLVLRGQLFRGARGHAGELGHVIVDPRGPECHCGARGCLEQLAGKEALLAAAGVSSLEWLRADATAGKARALEALEHAGVAIGRALLSALNVIDLDVVVLGGVYAGLARWLIPAVQSELSRRVSSPWNPATVLASSLGDDAAVRGAAGLVVHDILSN